MLLNDTWRGACLKSIHHFAAANQKTASLEINLAGIELLQRIGKLDSQPHRVELFPIHDYEADALDRFTLEDR